MFRRRVLSARRDVKAVLFQILVPVVTVALVMLLLKIKINPAGPEMHLIPKTLGVSVIIVLANNRLRLGEYFKSSTNYVLFWRLTDSCRMDAIYERPLRSLAQSFKHY